MVRLANPQRERHIGVWHAGEAMVASAIGEISPYHYAIKNVTQNTRTLGKYTSDKLDLHATKHPRHRTRWYSRTRMGLAMGYGVMRLMPLEDLRKLHNPVRGNAHLRQYHLLPKGISAADLAAINVYLERIGIEPCPFPLLVKRGFWDKNNWRELAKMSVLYGCWSHHKPTWDEVFAYAYH